MIEIIMVLNNLNTPPLPSVKKEIIEKQFGKKGKIERLYLIGDTEKVFKIKKYGFVGKLKKEDKVYILKPRYLRVEKRDRVYIYIFDKYNDLKKVIIKGKSRQSEEREYNVIGVKYID